jgi:hypothetical protein
MILHLYILVLTETINQPEKLLKKIGLAFIEINQNCFHEGPFGKNFSSPTLLMDNDIVIFDKKTESSGGASSKNLSDKD